jgi:hypothetical protein
VILNVRRKNARRRHAEALDDLRLHERQLGLRPALAGVDLRRVGLAWIRRLLRSFRFWCFTALVT